MFPKIKPILPFIIGCLYGVCSALLGLASFLGDGSLNIFSLLLIPAMILVLISIAIFHQLTYIQFFNGLQVTAPSIVNFITFGLLPALLSGILFQIGYLITRGIINKFRNNRLQN